MKKLIMVGAFLMFGTLLMSAQTTTTKDNMKSKAEKNLKSTELKMDTSVQNMKTNKKLDTANLDERQKLQDEKTMKHLEPQKDGLNNEAIKPAEPAPGKLE